jgi:rare lipoprotein A
VQAVDADARSVDIALGIFADPANAIALSERFALLGAVDEESVTVNGRAATRLTLTHLKPGVGTEDAVALARELGLGEIIR